MLQCKQFIVPASTCIPCAARPVTHTQHKQQAYVSTASLKHGLYSESIPDFVTCAAASAALLGMGGIAAALGLGAAAGLGFAAAFTGMDAVSWLAGAA